MSSAQMELFDALGETPAIPGLSAHLHPQKCQVHSVGLMSLGKRQCRWPVSASTPWLFCGAKTAYGSYCPEHRARAYRGR